MVEKIDNQRKDSPPQEGETKEGVSQGDTTTSPTPPHEEGNEKREGKGFLSLGGRGLRRGGEDGKPKRVKKKKSVLRKIIGWVVYLAVVGTLMYFTPKALSEYLGTDTPIAAITSGSMWPALKKGDLVFVKAVGSEKNLEIGDIIVFKNPKGYTIHRIVEKTDLAIKTKGDANNISDVPIKFSDVVGKTLEYSNGRPVRIPRMGYFSIWLNGRRQIER